MVEEGRLNLRVMQSREHKEPRLICKHGHIHNMTTTREVQYSHTTRALQTEAKHVISERLRGQGWYFQRIGKAEKEQHVCPGSPMRIPCGRNTSCGQGSDAKASTAAQAKSGSYDGAEKYGLGLTAD